MSPLTLHQSMVLVAPLEQGGPAAWDDRANLPSTAPFQPRSPMH